MSSLLWDIALKSLAIAAFGLAVSATMRRSSSATRHLVLTLTLVGLLVLPVVDLVLPRWQVPFVKVTVPVTTPSAASLSSAVDSAPISETIPSIPLGLLLWSAVGIVCVSRIGLRLGRLRRMERRLDMSDDPVLHGIVTDHCRRSRRHVLLLEGAPHEPPMTWGHFRPVLLLPSDAGSWQAGRLHSVVLHELAHIERGDWLASLVAQVACAAYWFNPFVWVISARMARESESAADDRVLVQGLSASQYASHLLEVLRDLRGSRASTDAALAMARPGSLDGRVRAILEERRCRRPARGMAALSLIASVTAVVALVAAAGPSVVYEASQAIAPKVEIETVPSPETPTPLIEPEKMTAKQPPVIKPQTHSTSAAAKNPGHRVATVSTSTNKTTAISNRNGSVAITGSGVDLSEMSSVGKEVGDSLREAQDEINRSMAEAQKDIEQAEKSGASKEQLKAARDAMNFGKDIATGTLKSVQPIIKSALNEGLRNAFNSLSKPPKQKAANPKVKPDKH